MKIVRLEAENFKRLKAVAIEPSGAVVEITGKNGAGKTSVLDAIWVGLAGKRAAPPVPIRKGEEEARISLDLGELKVIRKFKAKEDGTYTDTLVVESAEGARFPSPQGVLDALVGALTFDPLGFERMPAKDQFELCRAFVPDVDFVNLEGLNKGDFERRRDINRDAERAQAEADAIKLPSGADAPAALADTKELLSKIAVAAQVERMRERRNSDRDRITRLRAQMEDIAQEIALIEKALADEGEPDPTDVGTLRSQLAAAEERNRLFEMAAKKKAAQDRATSLKTQAQGLTQKINERNEEATAAVAKAKMPVPGLGFGDGYVTLDGLPFEQASDAQRLRASIAIAGAMHPRLSIIRVRDGSLLDAEAWATVTAYAEERDLQIWIETVASGRSHAVLIENGEVAAEPEAEDAGEVL